MVVRFVVVGGIVDYCRFKFLFIQKKAHCPNNNIIPSFLGSVLLNLFSFPCCVFLFVCLSVFCDLCCVCLWIVHS